MAFVLDNSVIAAWLLGEEGADAEAIVARLGDDEAHVPSLWPVELANVLVTAERRGRITEAQAHRAADIVLALPIRVVELRQDRVLRELPGLARQFHLTAYDASYLHVAMSGLIPLATFDRALAAAGRAAGLTVIGLGSTPPGPACPWMPASPCRCRPPRPAPGTRRHPAIRTLRARERYAESRLSIAPILRSSAWRASTSGRATRSRTEQVSAAGPSAIRRWLRRAAPDSAMASAMLSTTDCEARRA